jgi:transposase
MAVYVGLYASHGAIEICAVDGNGRRRWRGRCSGSAEALLKTLRRHVPKATRLGLEANNKTVGLARTLRAAGFKVVAMDAREVHALRAGRPVRTNTTAAETVAELLRSRFYRPMKTERRVARRLSRLLMVSVPLTVTIGLILMLSQVRLAYGIIDALPPPIARMLRGAYDAALRGLAPEHDGLRWIEIDDPRARKADKLQLEQK